MYVIKVETMTSKGERYLCGGVQVEGELRSKWPDETVAPGEVEDHGDGTYGGPVGRAGTSSGLRAKMSTSNGLRAKLRTVRD